MRFLAFDLHYIYSMKNILFIFLFFTASFAFAQDETTNYRLAQQYYSNGEYDKAVDLFEKLYSKSPGNGNYYAYYFYCLTQLKEFDKAEKVAKSQAKAYPGVIKYQVDRGYVLQLAGETEKSKEVYEKIVSNLTPNADAISNAAKAFESVRALNFALLTYKKGQQLLGSTSLFGLELAELYFRDHNEADMIDTYLGILTENPNQLGFIQNNLQARVTTEEGFDILKQNLLSRVQKNPDQTVFSELFIWFLVQNKDYAGGFIQAKALDKRMNEDGSRIIRLAHVADEDKDYDAALEMYGYLKAKGRDNNPNYFNAITGYVDTYKNKLIESVNFSPEEFKRAEKLYTELFTEYGYNVITISRQLGYAELLPKYDNRPLEAIELLNKAIDLPGMDARQQAQLKLDLGDYYLISGDIWEPTLLYGQVEKAYKHEPLGQEAKYRNARLSFYRGEFEWAQAQFDVLKASTSQFISNDAISLSLLIQDNLPLDTVTTAMEMYASADLCIFRNQLDEANLILDSILMLFNGHMLTDEIWMQQAKIEIAKRNYSQAIVYLDKILKDFPLDIMADDALYKKATITEEKLLNPIEAKDLYQKMILEYPNSIYAVDSRKRFRKLRGDQINYQPQ